MTKEIRLKVEFLNRLKVIRTGYLVLLNLLMVSMLGLVLLDLDSVTQIYWYLAFLVSLSFSLGIYVYLGLDTPKTPKRIAIESLMFFIVMMVLKLFGSLEVVALYFWGSLIFIPIALVLVLVFIKRSTPIWTYSDIEKHLNRAVIAEK